MPKRELQPQDPVRSTKSKRVRKNQESQSFVNVSSTSPSLDISKGHPTDPASDLQTDTPPDLSSNHATSTSTNFSKGLSTKLSADMSKDVSTDPSNPPPMNPSRNLLIGASTNPSQDVAKEEVSENGLKNFTEATHPFNCLMDTYSAEPKAMTVPTLSITAKNVGSFYRDIPFKHVPQTNNPRPIIEELAKLSVKFVAATQQFSFYMIDCVKETTGDADEIHRIEEIFDEFGQQDPYLPPSVVAERLGEIKLRDSTAQYIMMWALTTNMAVDADVRYTLLPPRILALAQDLDRHSSEAHRVLFYRWIQLTFGLLAGGYAEYQASAEAHRRVDRIRRFINKVLEPYRVQKSNGGDFSEKLDKILQLAMAIGYHLMGIGSKYRWDWTWLKPCDELLGREIVGVPPPRRPREEEVPEGVWITVPALVRETDDIGQQLKHEITLSEALQIDVINGGQVLDEQTQAAIEKMEAQQLEWLVKKKPEDLTPDMKNLLERYTAKEAKRTKSGEATDQEEKEVSGKQK